MAMTACAGTVPALGYEVWDEDEFEAAREFLDSLPAPYFADMSQRVWVETEVAFARPSDVHDYTDALAGAVTEVTQRFHEPSGRRYRVVVGGHPAPDRTP